MAIVNIYGFQNYSDYTSKTWNYQFTPFGKLPFWENKHGVNYNNTNGSGFRFINFQDRVWLRFIPGTYYSTVNSSGSSRMAAVRNGAFTVPLSVVFGDYIEDSSCTKFIFGCRWWWPETGNQRPLDKVVSVYLGSVNSESNGTKLLGVDETPNVKDVTFYMEFEFDLELGIVKRWMDSVRMSDVSLGSYSTRDTFKQLILHLGHKTNSTIYRGSPRQFGLNDFYFIADTSHLNDGLPSKRLGPIEVEALKPKAVTLPATWDNETEKVPADFLKETVDTVDVRNKPALVSDSAGDPAIVEFETPETKEGEVIYCELETYAYRDYGDSVALNTQVLQGTGSTPEKQFVIEPERLRTQENAIQPAKLHKPLDGDAWDEEKLGQIKLKLWSSKPE